MKHPFCKATYDGVDFFATSAGDRCAMVDRMDLATCRRALALTDLQQSVRTHLERRVRRLEKGVAA